MASNARTGEDAASGNDQPLNTVLDTINLHLNHEEGGSNEVHVDMAGVDDETEDEPHGHTHGEPRQQGNPAVAILMPYFAKFGAFVLIILLKILYSHRYGLLIVIGTVGTWYYADSKLTTQITLRTHTRYKSFVANILWVIVILACSLFGIYYFLDGNHSLACRLILSPSGLEKGVDLWTLLWHLIITDYAVKYVTIILKSLLTLIPKSIISNLLKGKLYMLIERLTQLYRSLLPTVPWYFFLLGSSDGPWFSAILFVSYVVCKFLQIYSLWSPLKTCILRVISSQESYGRKPTSQELEATEGTCPVCHDEYTDPMMLLCKHTFCEDCVLVWFDKETSCPMCRAKIITGDNTFRDGSSSSLVQFF